MGKRISVKEKIEDLESELEGIKLFKKVFGLDMSKTYSDLQKNIRNKGVATFNRILRTKFYIVWEKVGEADLYKIKEIKGGNELQETPSVKKTEEQLTLEF